MISRSIRNVRGFFSDYYFGSVLGRTRGKGRTKRHSDRDVARAYSRYLRIHDRADGQVRDAASCRERFLRPLFRDVLEYHLGAGEDHVHGLYENAQSEADGAKPLLLTWCGGWEADSFTQTGASSPRGLLERGLSRAGLRYGFLAAGRKLLLIRAPGEGGPRGAHLEIDLESLAEEDDPEGFALFLFLVSSRAFLPDVEGIPPIERIERESLDHASRVSADLKEAVFRAAESLAQGLIQDAEARDPSTSADTLSEQDLLKFRDASLTCLYRLLFTLYAEARDPRLQGHELYFQSYSAQGLLDEVQHDPSKTWPQNRTSLWGRLLALFRIYDEGLPAIDRWEHIPPRGGDFFSRRTPVGMLLESSRLPDRTVAQLIRELGTTVPRAGIGRERISFRELDIENLGAVYEGLLEHEPRVARVTIIEVRVQGKEYALDGPDLVRLCTGKHLSLKGDLAIVAGTEAESIHPEAQSEEHEDEDEDDSAEEPIDEDGIKKGGVAKLLRRLEPGSFHFVPGAARKGSGSFYTPLPLVQDIVRHAVGPISRGRSASEIERLRILDPACGSAHFLVEAMRFLGRELHRAYVEELNGKPPAEYTSTTGSGWDDDWRASDADARAANSEARAWCKRRIAERCLFGVDKNPTAVALAHVSLWIESLAGDRPLTYFEHHVRCGDSLLGTWLDRLDSPPVPTGKKDRGGLGLFEGLVRGAVEEAAAIRRQIDQADPDALRREGIDVDSVEELRFKERQRATAESELETVKLLFDIRSASAFVPDIWGHWATLCALISDPEALRAEAEAHPWWEESVRVRTRERFFHWELEFPEVFVDPERTGFDAVLGNPPWDKVLPTKHEFYARFDVLIRAYKGNELDRRIRELHAARPELKLAFDAYRSRTRTAAQVLRKSGDFPLSKARSGAAHEDVSKYFVDRAARLSAADGRVGMIVPSVLYNGDGCVGIRRFLLEKAAIERFYGFENRKKIFPIDSRYKFVSLVFRRGKPEDGFDAAFMRHDLSELEDVGLKPWLVRFSIDEIRRLSPETFAFLEYRGPRDQDILHRMYEPSVVLDSSGKGAWKIRLMSWRVHEAIFNSSADKDLWTNPATKKTYSPKSVLSNVPSDPDELLAAMREHGFRPVYEGKHIEQFLVGIKPVRWWLHVDQAKEKYGKPPRSEATLVFRETASNTNERTCIAAVLPSDSVGSHKLTGCLTATVSSEAAAAVLNSLCFDFALRLRTAGTNVSFTYMRPMPVPPADVVNRLPRIPTFLAWRDGVDHITDRRDLWPVLWDANRAVAEAYGLTPSDFEHILGSFPRFARKRRDFHTYAAERLEEWRAEVDPDAYPASAEPAVRVAEKTPE